MSSYAIAREPTPLLNTPDFASVFGAPQLPLDEKGLLRPVEMVALPGTKFQIKEQLADFILRVETQEYPHGDFYIDKRFVQLTTEEPPERQKQLPPSTQILEALNNQLGLPYIWGGNWGRGIPQLAKLYGPHRSHLEIRTLSGVDCSGLLYEATNGFTPRNTSELLSFGEKISDFSDVKPLDILIWPGHVVIALNRETSIESLYGKGVILSPLSERKHQENHQIRRFIIK